MQIKESSQPKRGMGKDIGGFAQMQKRFPDTEKEKYPGAYKPDQKVLALDRQMNWKVAEIYGVRPSKFFDESDEDCE